jgi:CelD/BcsL family acetyltransferase involved in cellulose biosynthesis
MRAAFEHFLDVEASGWKGAAGAQTAIKLNPDLRGLYSALIEHFSAIGACEINLLHIGDRCIAGQLCLVVDDTCYLLVLGYDEAYANLSPGVLLCHDMIMRHAASERVRFIDLFGDADWHRDWEPSRQEFSRCYFFDLTSRGRAAYLLMLMRRRLRPAYLRYYKPVCHAVVKWVHERALYARATS